MNTDSTHTTTDTATATADTPTPAATPPAGEAPPPPNLKQGTGKPTGKPPATAPNYGKQKRN